MPALLQSPMNGVADARSEVTVMKGKPVNDATSHPPEASPKINGGYPSLNGALTNGSGPARPASPEAQAGAIHDLFGHLPPEIEHITLGYRPLSILIGRLAQETFNGLRNVIEEMAKISLPQPQTNGISHNSANRPFTSASHDETPPNVRKKSHMFDFANTRRAQFIKVLVLSKWARQAEAIGKVIDLRIWLLQKQEEYTSAVHWMGILKRNLAPLKEPSPGMRTALEILALGKASWIPTLTYVPAQKLSPEQILAGLQRINSILSVRLNLHESIPSQYKDFSIASGRATFKIRNEFEVDVSVADEDLTHQLWFIDFRMTFSPTPGELSKGAIRTKLEGFANEKLAQGGVVGLLGYLRDFVLTQKLLILRNQAFSMGRSHWSGHIRVEPVRRVLIIQYWCGRPGAKSWIELGIRRGQPASKGMHSDDGSMSEIALRWFKSGHEVQDPEVDLRLRDLSIRYILEQVIAQHTSSIMEEMGLQLRRTMLYASGQLKSQHVEKLRTTASAALLVQLTASTAVKIVEEPVSGRVALLPYSDLNTRAETELNRLSALSSKGAAQILSLRSSAAHAAVEDLARQVGWERVFSYRPSHEALKNLFPAGTQKVTYYRRSFWSPGWLLAYTTSHDGDSWWVVEAKDGSKSTRLGDSASQTTRDNAVKVFPPTGDASVLQPSRDALLEIERATVGVLSHSVDVHFLLEKEIPHTVQELSLVDVGQVPSVYIQFPLRSRSSISNTSLSLPNSLSNEMVKLNYQGIDASRKHALQTAITSVAQPFSDAKDLALHMKGTLIDAASNRLTLRLQSRVGETSIPRLMHRVSAIGRLHEFLSVIKSQQLTVDHTSLERLVFVYQQRPTKMKASIMFPPDSAERLKLSPSNPHNRILDHLNVILQNEGLADVLGVMSTTTSLLSTLAWLETHNPCAGRSSTAQSARFYQIRYSAAMTGGGFDVRLRYRRDEAEWYIPEASIRRDGAGSTHADWQANLRAVTRGRGNGWRGMNGGIVAKLNGIRDVLGKLDSLYVNAMNSATATAMATTTTDGVPSTTRPGKRKAGGNVVEID